MYKFRDNAFKIVDKFSEIIQEQIATRVIKNKIDSETEASKKPMNVSNLRIGGWNARITANTTEKNKIQFDEEQLDNFRIKVGASTNEMKKVTNFLRCNNGRKAVPTNYSQHMTEKSNVLKDLYKTGTYEFDCENSKEKKERPVIYADAEEFFNKVIESRNLVGNFFIKVMADGGQGFFKISLTILPENVTKIFDENNCTQQDYYDDYNKNYVSLYKEFFRF